MITKKTNMTNNMWKMKEKKLIWLSTVYHNFFLSLHRQFTKYKLQKNEKIVKLFKRHKFSFFFFISQLICVGVDFFNSHSDIPEIARAFEQSFSITFPLSFHISLLGFLKTYSFFFLITFFQWLDMFMRFMRFMRF